MDQLNFLYIKNAPTTYRTNNTPCAIPTVWTISGMCQMYFSGMAMPKRTRKEIASKELINRNALTEFSNIIIFRKDTLSEWEA